MLCSGLPPANDEHGNRRRDGGDRTQRAEDEERPDLGHYWHLRFLQPTIRLAR